MSLPTTSQPLLAHVRLGETTAPRATVLAMHGILGAGRNQIPLVFGVEGPTARYVAFFCLVGGLAWVFIGLVLVSNAAFNNLGFPLYSTAFNWGRATLGTVPLAWLGAHYHGVEGAITGLVGGSLVFGLAAVFTVFRAIKGLEQKQAGIAGPGGH